MRQIVAGLAIGASLLLAGCIPESEQPLAAADPAKTDPRLWGSWLAEEEDGYSIAHVFALEDGKLEIVFAEHDVEGVGKVETYQAHATQLPSGDYLNVVVTGEESGYVIGKYEFAGTNEISIAFADSQQLEQAVKDGKLAGTITPETGGGNDLHITATSEQWQGFLAKAPADLFGEPSSFKRVGPAYVEQQ